MGGADCVYNFSVKLGHYQEDRFVELFGMYHDEGQTEHDQEVPFTRSEVVGELRRARPVGVGAASQRLIPTGEQSGL